MADAERAPGAAGDAAAATRYDLITYPSGVFARMGPNRMQVFAYLHGIAAAPLETARVLEVGGNDGLNLTAFAAAFPGAECLSFDLSPEPVARGQALARAAGIGNMRVELGDILTAATDLPGEYDYIIVHGVYAWVPAPVRAAIMTLIGRVLAPNGVVAISYNTLPGGVLGQTLRAMAEAEVGDEPDERVRFEKSLAALRSFSEGQPEGIARSKQEALIQTLKVYARELLDRPPALVAHDDLGGWYEPQAFAAVCAAAGAVGLAYLNDTMLHAATEGFSGIADQAALVRRIQANDHRDVTFFRHSLFVRDGLPIERRLDLELVDKLWMWSALRRVSKGQFARGESSVAVADNRAAVILIEAERRCPERLPLAGLEPAQLKTFVDLFLMDAVSCTLGSKSGPSFSERPRLSALARAQIERGDARIATMEQGVVVPSAEVCRFMLLFDGTRDIAALAAEAKVGVAEAAAIVSFVGANALLVA